MKAFWILCLMAYAILLIATSWIWIPMYFIFGVPDLNELFLND
jgi:hypothetical protein